jgi:FkbM family methyltransferase
VYDARAGRLKPRRLSDDADGMDPPEIPISRGPQVHGAPPPAVAQQHKAVPMDGAHGLSLPGASPAVGAPAHWPQTTAPRFQRFPVAKLRPAKVASALRRRWFEHWAPRVRLEHVPGLVDHGSAYGGWTLPARLIQPSWTCYLVGAGGDVSVDLELIRRYGVQVRSFDAVADFVESGRRDAADEPRFSAHHAAIALTDGPLRMQVSHDPQSQSVSAAQLYDSRRFVELPGRTLASLMAELGDEQIDLLKLDIEGSEYELLATLDLRALGVKVFSIQLHHTGSVRDARRLIARLREAGYDPVACRPVVKLTFVRRDLLNGSAA